MAFRSLLLAMMLQVVPASAMAAEVNYTCEDQTLLTANFQSSKDGPGSVELLLQGANERVNLPQVLSADGGRYADGKTEFWIKGMQATLMRAGKTTICKAAAK